jgi:uncharacterized protein (DUF433 family)
MDLPDFLVEASLGEIRLINSRIGLFHVVDHHNHGYSALEIHEQFPSLPLDLIEKVVRYYESHRSEVDAYMTRCYAEVEDRYARTPKIDFAELRHRKDAMDRAGPK